MFENCGSWFWILDMKIWPQGGLILCGESDFIRGVENLIFWIKCLRQNPGDVLGRLATGPTTSRAQWQSQLLLLVAEAGRSPATVRYSRVAGLRQDFRPLLLQ